MPIPAEAPALIRAKLQQGKLPKTAPRRMWAGYGTRQLCDGCDQPILPAQVEYEFTNGESELVRMHLGCAAVWEKERQQALLQ